MSGAQVTPPPASHSDLGHHVKCVAIIGQRNTPLYLRATEHTDAVAKWHFLAHSALDVAEECVKQHTNPYLGHLLSIEDWDIYGFQSSSQIKVMLMLEQSNEPFLDDQVQILCKAVHAAYLSYMSNPFLGYESTDASRFIPLNTDPSNAPITDAHFDRRILQILGL